MASETIIMKLDAKELMSELREEMRQVFHAGWTACEDAEGVQSESKSVTVDEAWLKFEKETFGDA